MVGKIKSDEEKGPEEKNIKTEGKLGEDRRNVFRVEDTKKGERKG